MNWKRYGRKWSWPIEMLSRYFFFSTEKSDEICWFAAGIRSKSLTNKTLPALNSLVCVMSAMRYIDVCIRNVINFLTQIPRSAYDICTKLKVF